MQMRMPSRMPSQIPMPMRMPSRMPSRMPIPSRIPSRMPMPSRIPSQKRKQNQKPNSTLKPNLDEYCFRTLDLAAAGASTNPNYSSWHRREVVAAEENLRNARNRMVLQHTEER